LLCNDNLTKRNTNPNTKLFCFVDG
jgi:hypothetical protein